MGNVIINKINLKEGDKIKKRRLKTPIFKVHDMKNSFISVDKAFEYIGDNSRYQKRAITIFSIVIIVI